MSDPAICFILISDTPLFGAAGGRAKRETVRLRSLARCYLVGGLTQLFGPKSIRQSLLLLETDLAHLRRGFSCRRLARMAGMDENRTESPNPESQPARICPKCGGSMCEGFMRDLSYGAILQAIWVEGEPVSPFRPASRRSARDSSTRRPSATRVAATWNPSPTSRRSRLSKPTGDSWPDPMPTSPTPPSRGSHDAAGFNSGCGRC